MARLMNRIYHTSISNAIVAVRKVPISSWIHSSDDKVEDEKLVRDACYNGLYFIIGQEDEFTQFYNDAAKSLEIPKPNIQPILDPKNCKGMTRLRIENKDSPYTVIFDHADEFGKMSKCYKDLVRRIREHYQKSDINQTKDKFEKLLSE